MKTIVSTHRINVKPNTLDFIFLFQILYKGLYLHSLALGLFVIKINNKLIRLPRLVYYRSLNNYFATLFLTINL